MNPYPHIQYPNNATIYPRPSYSPEGFYAFSPTTNKASPTPHHFIIFNLKEGKVLKNLILFLLIYHKMRISFSPPLPRHDSHSRSQRIVNEMGFIYHYNFLPVEVTFK